MRARGNPFDDLERLFDQYSRELREMAQEFDGGQWAESTGASRMGIDLTDEGDEFVVTADVPGYDKDEIDLQLRDDALHIRATHEERADERDADYLRHERQHRSLRESVTLPEPVDEENVTATCRNGVLTVHLPKREPTEAGGHRIDIE